jgi:putative inorganic carbon (hco3(-)) transporter
MFVGIAFQPFMFLILAAQIGLHGYLKRREAEARWKPITAQVGGAEPAIAAAPNSSRWGG